MTNTCVVCGIEFTSEKKAKTCSPKCRVTLSRSGVTKDPNVTLASPAVTLAVTFEFTVARKKNDDTPNPVRKAKYWYDVPLAAVPVIKKGWPKMPDYMNGRQYFLWWKNEFQEGDNGPIILNPF